MVVFQHNYISQLSHVHCFFFADGNSVNPLLGHAKGRKALLEDLRGQYRDKNICGGGRIAALDAYLGKVQQWREIALVFVLPFSLFPLFHRRLAYPLVTRLSTVDALKIMLSAIWNYSTLGKRWKRLISRPIS